MAVEVKKLPAVQETQVRSLGQEDPPEKQMATHSSVLAWEIQGQRRLVATVHGLQTSGRGGEGRTRGKPNGLSPSEPSAL